MFNCILPSFKRYVVVLNVVCWNLCVAVCMYISLLLCLLLVLTMLLVVVGRWKFLIKEFPPSCKAAFSYC